MTRGPSPSPVQNAWLDAVLADLQRQIDNLADQVSNLAGQLDTFRQTPSHTTAARDHPPDRHENAAIAHLQERCDD